MSTSWYAREPGCSSAWTHYLARVLADTFAALLMNTVMQPQSLAQIAGLWVSGTGRVTGLDQDAAIRQLSRVLRSSPKSGDRCVITT